MEKHQAFSRLAQQVGYAKAYKAVYGEVPDAKTFVRTLDSFGFGSTTISPLLKGFYGYGSESTVERILRPERMVAVEKHKAKQLDLMRSTACWLYFKGLTKETTRQLLTPLFDKRAMKHFSPYWDSLF